MPRAYNVHPEFGYLCPAPRVRRDLRVALVSILFGMVIGAAIVTIRAGQAVETNGVSNNAHLKSSGPDTLVDVAGPTLQFKTVDDAKADPVEAIKPYPTRMVRVRSSKAASPIAGIPLGHTAAPEPGIAPASAAPASPESPEGPGSPAASPRAQSFVATVEPAVSGTKKRLNVVRAKRHRDEENENARSENRRAPYWGERRYADDQYWRSGYRNWVY